MFEPISIGYLLVLVVIIALPALALSFGVFAQRQARLLK